MENWQRKALGKLADHFNAQLIEDAETETFSIGHVILTPPHTSENEGDKWLTGIEIITRGVRYRRDGSGEPDCADYNDDRECGSFQEAFVRIGELHGHSLADNILEDAQWDDANGRGYEDDEPEAVFERKQDALADKGERDFKDQDL